MLKIDRSTEGKRVVFTLNGQIKVEHLAELQRLFALEGDDHRRFHSVSNEFSVHYTQPCAI